MKGPSQNKKTNRINNNNNGASRAEINGEVSRTRATSSMPRRVQTRMAIIITVLSNSKISMVIKLTINGVSINSRTSSNSPNRLNSRHNSRLNNRLNSWRNSRLNSKLNSKLNNKLNNSSCNNNTNSIRSNSRRSSNHHQLRRNNNI